MYRAFILVLTVLVAVGSLAAQKTESESKTGDGKTGILLLAHGGKQNWNEEVMKVASTVDKKVMTEVAFGMASKRTIQDAADKLVARGVTKIVAVPLFVSSNSSVITSTEYLLGLRNEAPRELAIFAKMDHGDGGGHSGHQASDKAFDPATPIKIPVPVQMAPGLNDHPIVAEILLSRAVSISEQPEKEVVVVVAHGPVSDETNRKWLADMGSLVKLMSAKSSFKRIQYLTVRDDAPEPIRSQATAELRAVVERAAAEKSRVLIVPLLVSYGGIEEGIKKRLEGLSYTMSPQALLPDQRLAEWVLLSCQNRERLATGVLNSPPRLRRGADASWAGRSADRWIGLFF